jgi:hypothetical protein
MDISIVIREFDLVGIHTELVKIKYVPKLAILTCMGRRCIEMDISIVGSEVVLVRIHIKLV